MMCAYRQFLPQVTTLEEIDATEEIDIAFLWEGVAGYDLGLPFSDAIQHAVDRVVF